MDKTVLVDVRRKRELRLAVQSILRQSRYAAIVSSAATLLLTTGNPAQGQDAAASNTSSEPALAEIVVSAQRRTQSLQDVPYNISAIAGDALRDAGVISINSLTELVPGLTNVDQGPANRAGNNNFILRGLRTDSPGGGASGEAFPNLTVSPVSTYFGETPVFFQIPLDDLERVEVLRGPQGTLYGSGSQAGTIRFIPKSPDFNGFSGEVNAEGSYTEYSQDPNGRLHAIFNIPIADNLALRVVAGEDHVGGFIKAVDRAEIGPTGAPVPSIPGDLTSGFVLAPIQKGSNTSDQAFVRTSLRWKPTDGIDVHLDYVHEHTSLKDSQFGSAYQGGPFDTSFGAYPNATINERPGCNFCTTELLPEPYKDTINLVDLVGTFDVGLGTVTSTSSYYADQSVTNYDQTGTFYGNPGEQTSNGSFIIPFYPYLSYPRQTSPSTSPYANRSFIEELRLVSTPGKIVDYVVGLFYQRQTQSLDLTQYVPGIEAYLDYIGQPNSSTHGDVVYAYNRNTQFAEKAVFGELTFHLTDRWQLTGGTRFFQQPYSSTDTGVLPLYGELGGLENYGSSTSNTYSSHIWKLNSSYDFTSTLKAYATFSEGYRHGGVSGLPSGGAFASPLDLGTFKPDLAKNYELGVKGSLFEHRINYFADIYLVNIYDFQFDALSLSGGAGAFNGSTARSQGLESEAQIAITDHFTAGVGYAFTRSYVTKAFNILDYPPFALIPSDGGTGAVAPLFGGPIPEGRQLPGVSRNIANVSGDYTLPVGSVGKLTFHADGSYRSAETSNINPGYYYFVIPSAFIGNVRVSMSTKDNFTYSLFVRNVTNNPDISGGLDDQEFGNPYRLRTVGTPRTFGLGVRYKF